MVTRNPDFPPGPKKDDDKRDKKEKPFDPHSVASSQTLEEQRQSEEIRQLLAKGSVISPEMVRTPDIDIKNASAGQYGNKRVRKAAQAEMDKLNKTAPENVNTFAAQISDEADPDARIARPISEGERRALEASQEQDRAVAAANERESKAASRTRAQEQIKQDQKRPDIAHAQILYRTLEKSLPKIMQEPAAVGTAYEGLSAALAEAIKSGDATKLAQATKGAEAFTDAHLSRAKAEPSVDTELEAIKARLGIIHGIEPSGEVVGVFGHSLGATKAFGERQAKEQERDAGAVHLKGADMGGGFRERREAEARGEIEDETQRLIVPAGPAPFVNTVKVPQMPHLDVGEPMPGSRADIAAELRVQAERAAREKTKKEPAVFRKLRGEKKEAAGPKPLETEGMSAAEYLAKRMEQEAAARALPKEETRAGWQRILAGLINAKEKTEWWASSKEGLIRRSAELDTELEKMGGAEKSFRWVGEKYNKLDWKGKLAVGLAIGVGGGVVAAAGSPLVWGFALLGGVQRAAGLSTMFLKYEKAALDKNETFAKEKALAKAIGYSVVMSAAMLGIGYAVKEASQTEFVRNNYDRVRDFLADKLGHHPMSPAPSGSEIPSRLQGIAPGDYPESATVPHQASADVQAAALENGAIPNLSGLAVDATPGQGYEYMMKQLAKQLHEHPLDLKTLNDLPADSDIRRLASVMDSNPANLGKTVHDLAIEHGFFKDGASIQIDLSSRLAFDNDGQLAFSDAVHRTPFSGAPVGFAVTPPLEAAAPQDLGGIAPGNFGPAGEAPSTGVEAASNAAAVGPIEVTLQQPEGPAVVDLTAAQDLNPNVSQAQTWENPFHVNVTPEVGTIYSDSSNTIFAFGAKAHEAAEAYVRAHHDATVLVQSSSLGADGKPFVEQVAFKGWGIFGSVEVTAPKEYAGLSVDPNEFTKRLTK